MQIYHVETQEDYDALGKDKLPGRLGSDGWLLHKADTCIFIDGNDNYMLFGINNIPKNVKDIPIIKYKAKQNDVESAIETVTQDNAELFHKIITDLEQTYLAKNKDYGNSFEESLNEYGEIAGLVRIGDKFNRAKNLSKNKANVTDESKIDTLFDMANYCIMQAIWMMKQED